MDLQIEKNGQVVRLAQLGFYNINIHERSPTVELGQRSIKGRNGRVFDDVTLVRKTIKVSARLAVPSLQAFYQKVDEVTGFLFDDIPFYARKMVPSVDNLYDFERPGQKTGELAIQNIPHQLWHYRHKVVADGELDWEFIGKSAQGLKYNVSFQFVTAELPFGETVPKTVTLSGGAISYNGTAPFSQLEKPWEVELTSTGGQNGFYLTIGGRKYTFAQQSPIASGTVFQISGTGTLVNKVNMTNKTNYEYFVLEPQVSKMIPYQTDFRGTIKIKDFMELYR